MRLAGVGVMVALSSLAGCGQKGPLKLPALAPAAAASPTAAASAAPGSR